jgi:hypothetical protein
MDGAASILVSQSPMKNALTLYVPSMVKEEKMEDFKCDWCEKTNNITAMVSGHKMPIICRCGTKVGYIGWEDLRDIINERDYYKKKYLTNRKK